MRTNELKKGDIVMLANGWAATIMDNMRGNRRMAEVDGFTKEVGSIYAHNIRAYMAGQDEHGGTVWVDIEYTKSQEDLRRVVSNFFGGE
jgi:hypothetical protein